MKNERIPKFRSFFGFAITEAKKKGDKVIIGFQFNVNDGYSKESKLTMIQYMLDDIVYPEVMRRIADKKLDSSFKLNKAHILLFSKHSKNDILLNNEVRFNGNIRFVENKTAQPNDVIQSKDIEEILGLYPNEKNDPNAAHIMLLKFKGKWNIAIDLIYDREKVRKKFNLADDYLQSAEHSFKKKLWGPFVDNLFSITELAIQSILLLRHYEEYSRKQSHQKTREILEVYCKHGNAPMNFLKHYEKMSELRKKGRYSTGVHGKKFTIKINEAKQYMKTTQELVVNVTRILQTVEDNRKPRSGDYVNFGEV